MQKVPEKTKTKYLRVTMPDGSKWDVPAEVIAENRADHYSGYHNDFELKDWAENNMNWADVAKYAELVVPAPPPQIGFQDGWVNGKKEIVEK